MTTGVTRIKHQSRASAIPPSTGNSNQGIAQGQSASYATAATQNMEKTYDYHVRFYRKDGKPCIPQNQFNLGFGLCNYIYNKHYNMI